MTPTNYTERARAHRVQERRIRAAARDMLALVEAIVVNRSKCFIPTDDPSASTFNWDELAAAAIAKTRGPQ